MSGMFQRIGRRHADRSDEQVPADHGTEAGGPPAAPPADAAAPAADAAAPPPGDETVDAPTVDAPTERLQPVAAPPPAIDLTSHLPAAAAPASTPAQPGPVPAAPQPATAEQTVALAPAARRPGFRARGRMRRRLRYLRKLRELQVRDLGGLVFDLRRFGRAREDLVTQKVDQIRACDDELRALETALDERRDLRDVREPGIGGTCPRCFAIYGSADRFCANCGAALGGAVQSPAHVPLAPPATQAPPASAPEASGPAAQP